MNFNIKENLPKFLFFFSLAIIVLFILHFVINFLFDNSGKIPDWLLGPILVCLTFLPIILAFVIPSITILLLILSIFLHFKRKFLWITLILSLSIGIPFVFFSLNRVPAASPDAMTKADLQQISAAEEAYFADRQQYGTFDDLVSHRMLWESVFKYPETGKPYSLILSEDKQNFELRAELEKGGQYVCNREKCEEIP